MKIKFIKQRIEKLRQEIDRYRFAYHVLDEAKISDSALDGLKNELQKLEIEYPQFITPDSPTQRIGGEPLEKFNKFIHSSLMFSLFDAFSSEDMINWENRLKKLLPVNKIFHYFGELKLDGLAAALIYQNGTFFQGATRGNGKIGEEVTFNLRTIEAVPLKLRIPTTDELLKINFTIEQSEKIQKIIKFEKLEIRGEVIMTKKVFHSLNEQYKKENKPLFANPRNGAAGSIRQLDPGIAAERQLDFYAYSLNSDCGQNTREQENELLKLIGFKTTKENKFCSDLNAVFQFYNELNKKREKLPFECDGVVIKINELNLWNILGVVGKGPRYMMAYKFASEQAVTKVKNVFWQIGRTGTLTPVALLEPTFVNGVTITHATLHNLDEIKRLDLRIGDTVILERAGDVIPKIIQVLNNLRNGEEQIINPPLFCPVCESSIVKDKIEVALRCVNKKCYAVNLKNLIHWASKSAVNIDGLGPKVIEKLVNARLINDISDFYILKFGDILSLEGFAQKAAENLIASIEEKKEIELARFVYGLGIRHIGEETTQKIAEKIKNKSNKINDIVLELKMISLKDWEALPDIGPIVARSLFDWFRDEHNLSILKKLENNGVIIKYAQNNLTVQKFKNKSFVLTGTLNSLTRDQAKEKIKELGGEVSSIVGKKTNFVLAGVNPGSKLDKANKFGVKIITEEEFLMMYKIGNN